MEGRGAYNRSSCVQATGSSAAVPLFEKAASLVQLPSAADPVVIADYGSSEGHNSLEPLTAAIAVLRRRIGPERAESSLSFAICSLIPSKAEESPRSAARTADENSTAFSSRIVCRMRSLSISKNAEMHQLPASRTKSSVHQPSAGAPLSAAARAHR